MTSFTLDTSGAVAGYAETPSDVLTTSTVYRWPDLSPFEQGYVEAMFASAYQSLDTTFALNQWDAQASDVLACYVPRFSDLSPEALARIRRDCAVRLSDSRASGQDVHAKSAIDGRWFWDCRQSGTLPHLPPLTPYLADDGKVHLREGA